MLNSLFKDRMGKGLTSNEVIRKSFRRFYNYWLDFELMFLWIVGYIPSHTLRKIFYQMAGVSIGKGSTLHMWSRFYQPKNIIIGEDTIIGDHAFLDGRAPLIIGSHVDIASEVMIYNSEHKIDSEDFSAREEKVEIEDYVFIGPRVIILPGVKIEKGAVVAAGAVVNSNVSAFNIVGGVPAKPIGDRKVKDLHYRLGRARLFQ